MMIKKGFRRLHGFSLIEIVVIIAVVAILAVIAIPVYQNYVIRSRVAEGFEFADAARIKVILARQEGASDALGKGFETLSSPSGHMLSLQWVPVSDSAAQADAVLGYLLPAMNLLGLGVRDAFALEFLNNGQWRCVNAAAAAGRQKISANEALDDKYLPAVCHSNGGLLAQHPQTPPGCPPGAQQVQMTDANGKTQQVCRNNTIAQQPVLQPSLQPQLQPQAQPHKQPLLAPQLVPQVTPQPTCPVGQDCFHQDPKCPNGQMFWSGGQVVIRGTHTPFESTSWGDNSASITLAPQCVAKCSDGFVFNPHAPTTCGVAPATNNHMCRGPKFICERAHMAKPACPADAPYAANHIENLQDGSRYVTRSCITQKEAFDADKYNKAHPDCANYSVNTLVPVHFRCTFACLGDSCNIETVPVSQATWADGKEATDLPDNFK